MYQALYRKYRPRNFDEVVSQKAILQTLKNSIRTSHIGHAYLFSGPRGTGKTTVAKIFARAVNCTNLADGEICNQCSNCNYSNQKECMDIIEIDAASNNGVDEIRELRSKVNILPTELKYKVYIIDEVHMLSIGAFNALLKTLEEPPRHVIFILATTDPQKIPATIISRCQCYNFKKISNEDIIIQLEKISQKENIVIEKEALDAIANSSDGGLRDAIGLLDKVRAYQNDNITLNDFLIINGQVEIIELEKLEYSIFNHIPKNMIERINQYYGDGKDLVQILKQLMMHLKNMLVDYYLNSKPLQFDEQEIIDFINLLNEKLGEIKKTDDVKMYIEIMFLHFLNHHSKSEKIISREIISEKDNQKKNDSSPLSIEKKPERSSSVKNTNESYPDFERVKQIMTVRSQNAMAKAIKEELNMENLNWQKLNDYTFDVNSGYLACELLDGKPKASSNSILVVSYEYDTLIKKMSSHFQELINFYQTVTSSSKILSFITEEEWNKLKSKYIQLLREGKNFSIEEEPKFEIIKEKKSDSTVNGQNDEFQDVIDLFGDIVEIK